MELEEKIKTICSQFSLEYDEKNKLIRNTKNCSYIVNMTYEFLEDIEAYFHIDSIWLIDQIFDIHEKYFINDEINCSITMCKDKKTFYLRLGNDKDTYKHWILPMT